MKGYPVLVKNFFSLAISDVTSKLLASITLIIIARTINPVNFGLINYLIVLNTYFLILLNPGFDTLGLRDISKNINLMHSYVNNIITIRIISGLLGFAAINIVAFVLFYKSNERIIQTGLFTLITFNMIIYAFSIQWVYQGLEKMHFITIRQVGITFLNLIGIIFLVKNPSDYYLVIIIMVLSNLVNIFLMFIFYLRKYDGFYLSFNISLWRQLFIKSFPFALAAIITGLYQTNDILIIGIVSSNKDLGIYSSALKVYNFIVMPASVIMYTFLPRLSKFGNDVKNNALNIKLFGKILFIFSVPITLAIFFTAPFIVNILFGVQYNEASPILKLLGLNAFLTYLTITFGSPLLILGHEKLYYQVYTIGLILSSLFIYFSLRYFTIYGVVIAKMIAEISTCLMFYINFKKLFHISFFNIFSTIILFAFICLILCYGLNELGLNLLINTCLGIILYGILLQKFKFLNFWGIVKIA